MFEVRFGNRERKRNGSVSPAFLLREALRRLEEGDDGMNGNESADGADWREILKRVLDECGATENA